MSTQTQSKKPSAKKHIDIALIGNPNAGKTTVFNALTGLRHRVGNYPGVTVEHISGMLLDSGEQKIEMHDLPGLYSLVPKSLDDKISSDIITGRSKELEDVRLVVVVADATNLSRSLFLVTQVVELGKPALLALNMMDSAEKRGLTIDVDILAKKLGIPVIPICACKNKGIKKLKAQILTQVTQENGKFEPSNFCFDAETKNILQPIQSWLQSNTSLNNFSCYAEALRVLSNDLTLENWRTNLENNQFAELNKTVTEVRQQLETKDTKWHRMESELRYRCIDNIYSETVTEVNIKKDHFSEKLDRVLTHRVAGPIIFVLIFGAIFQSIFAWAEVPMNLIESFIGWLGIQIAGIMPDGVIEDLIVDGGIAGVGAILIFLPQILFLFFFLSILEDTGYLSRAAFIMDRIMKGVGLSGRSVIPLLSSFACAIPGIMATRTIRNPRDRLVTIMIAPLMSCSARLPVFALMIGAFIPNIMVGFLTLPGLLLLSLYLLGILAAVVAAYALNRFGAKKQRPSTFVLELPPYRMPSIRWTFLQMWERAKIFVTDAGKIILAISIILWFMASYPKPATEMSSSQAIKQSYAGQLGHVIEPVIKPLGFDWKMGIGLIASFAAREVMVSTLATIYNVEDANENSHTLREAMRNETDPDTGKKVYTPLVALSLMVFFVLACQCMSTVAVVKRETNSWRWPIIMIIYMTSMAYVGSLLVYQGGLLLGLS